MSHVRLTLAAITGFSQKEAEALNSTQPCFVILLFVALLLRATASVALGQDALDSRLGRTISVAQKIRNFAVSPDGSVIATVTRDDTISFFESDSGRKVGETPRLVFRNWLPLEFSPDSKYVACCEVFQKQIRIWDARTGTEHATLKVGNQEPRRFIFSPDSTSLLVAAGHEVVLWSLATKAPIKTLRCPEGCVVMDLAWLANGRQVVTGGGGSDKAARVWDLESAKELQAFANHREDVSRLACSTDGSRLVTLSGFEVRLFNLLEGTEIKRATVRDSGAVQFTPDSKYVFIGSTDNVQEFLDSRTLGSLPFREVLNRETPLSGSEQHPLSYHAVAFSADGRWVAFESQTDKKVCFWAGLSRPIGTLPTKTGNSIAPGLTFSRNGKRLAFRRADDELAVLNCEAFAEAAEKELAAGAEKERLAAIAHEREAKQAAEMAAARAEEVRRASEKVAADAALQVKNWQPQWSDSEDLNALLRSFHGSEDGQGVDDDKHLRAFIRYGTPKNARKAERGDRFDKEDAAHAAAEHREKMRSRRFHLCCEYTWDEAADTGPTAVMLRVRLPLRCHVPFSDRAIGARDIVETEWWYLAEPKKPQKCANEQEASQRDRLGQEIYLPENAYYTTLLLRVNAPREVLKAIARDPASHRVNVGITKLEIARPMQLGLFRLATLRTDHFDTVHIRRRFEGGLINPEKPDYFVTQILERADDERIQEAVMCHLDRIEVVRATPEERQVVFEWKWEK